MLKNNGQSKLGQHLTRVNDSLIIVEKTDIRLQIEEIYADDKMKVYRYKTGEEK